MGRYRPLPIVLLFFVLPVLTGKQAEALVGMDFSAVPPVDIGSIVRAPDTWIGSGVSVTGIVRAKSGTHLIQLQQIRGKGREPDPVLSVLVNDNTAIRPGANMNVIGRLYELSGPEAEKLTGFRLDTPSYELLKSQPPVVVAYRLARK